MPSNNRLSAQFPRGLERRIREGASTSGVSLANYVTQLIAAGYHATEHESMAAHLYEVTAAIERNTHSISSSSQPGAALPGNPEVLLKTIAAILARVQLIGGKLDIESAKVEALATTTFKTLSGRG